MSMMEHPLWTEDLLVRDPWLDLWPSAVGPGTVALHWRGGDGAHELLLSGNAADDLLERYRAAEDHNGRAAVLRAEIEGALAL